MADFISKYTGEKIEQLLDKAGQIHQIESQVTQLKGDIAALQALGLQVIDGKIYQTYNEV